MSLSESQAQRIVLVRALEQSRDGSKLWSASDAKEATRAVGELVSAKAPFAAFVARRAELVLEDTGKRLPPGQTIALCTSSSLGWLAWALAVLSLCGGFMVDHLSAGHRVHVLEPSLVLLIVWNLIVFAWLSVAWLARRMRQHGSTGCSLIEWAGRWCARMAIRQSIRREQAWVAEFLEEWGRLSEPLNVVRVKLTMHLAALSFAVGATTSLFVRGLFKEYRAGWETTFSFVNGEVIHTLVSWALLPGALLLRQPIPDARHIDALRFPESQGEVAGPWIALYAGSILAWVILPRLYLVLLNATVHWHWRRAFPLSLKGAYFTNLRAAWQGQAIRVVAVPFRYELSADLRGNLERVLERVYGVSVTVAVEPAVLMGEDAADWKQAVDSLGYVAVLVVFSLAATAERDAHGALLRHLSKRVGRSTPIVPIVDTGSYPQVDRERFRQRCSQWRQILDSVGAKPLFLDLHKVSEEDLKALETRLNHEA